MSDIDDFKIRDALAHDREALLNLLPGLADFPVPEARVPAHLWQSDAELLCQHLGGEVDRTIALVAVDPAGLPVGLALMTLCEELLSHEPSAHLEALVVAADARGNGLGRRLLTAAEMRASSCGARSLTLHAFRTNTLARGLYESAGFDAELLRYSKPLPKAPRAKSQ